MAAAALAGALLVVTLGVLAGPVPALAAAGALALATVAAAIARAHRSLRVFRPPGRQ